MCPSIFLIFFTLPHHTFDVTHCNKMLSINVSEACNSVIPQNTNSTTYRVPHTTKKPTELNESTFQRYQVSNHEGSWVWLRTAAVTQWLIQKPHFTQFTVVYWGRQQFSGIPVVSADLWEFLWIPVNSSEFLWISWVWRIKWENKQFLFYIFKRPWKVTVL